MFESISTVSHANKAERHLLEHYTSKEAERRVEQIYESDYDNVYLDLQRVPLGHAKLFYQERFLKRYGPADA